VGQVVGRRKGGIGVALVTVAVLVGASACGGGSGDKAAGGNDGKAAGKPGASAKPSPAKPKGPPMLLETITPLSDAKVGVAMPISVVFTNPVAAKARASVEKHMKVSTSQPVAGAWHWFGDRRADWRPKTYWPSGTKVKVDADMKGVSNGNGRYGVHGYTHSFTVGDDVRADVSVTGHTMKVTKNGQAVRTLSINAGSAEYPTWNGTMVVLAKQSTVRMTSASVNIATSSDSSDFYDEDVKYAVRLTTSGTFVHAAPWNDSLMGRANGSHGCIGMSTADARWFFARATPGDVVVATGSTRATVDKGNGYGDWNLSAARWRALSALS
jgi:lipoprotein-anchoring transpeptidase ErfK/SrfK